MVWNIVYVFNMLQCNSLTRLSSITPCGAKQYASGLCFTSYLLLQLVLALPGHWLFFTSWCCSATGSLAAADFDLKLMDIDSEHLGIPETEYSATIRMPASEYSRIVRDLSSIGDTVTISATKEGVKFSTQGDVGTANITIR
jgi:hypothetical protein